MSKSAKAPSRSAVAQPETTPAPEPKREFVLCAEWKSEDGIQQRLLLDEKSRCCPWCMFIEEGGKPLGGRTDPRQVSVSAAFLWWFERRILDDKTGDFTEYPDGMDEVLRLVSSIVAESEARYWKETFKRRNKAAKKFLKLPKKN